MNAQLVVNRAKKLKTRRNFHFWFVGFDNRADNGDINVLGTDIVRRRDHGNVYIYVYIEHNYSVKPQKKK